MIIIHKLRFLKGPHLCKTNSKVILYKSGTTFRELAVYYSDIKVFITPFHYDYSLK